MEDSETARMRKYGESKTTRIMMATVPHVTFGLGLRKFQADGFLLTRVYVKYHSETKVYVNLQVETRGYVKFHSEIKEDVIFTLRSKRT